MEQLKEILFEAVENNPKIGSATFKKYFDILFDLGKKSNFTDEEILKLTELETEIKALSLQIFK